MSVSKMWFAAGILMLGSVALAGQGAKGGTSPVQQAEVEDLPVCYARGTDTL